MTMTNLTELEGAVLGVVWSRGPITPYGVRRQFLDSPTRGWSSSTGAIYPAIKRLIQYGLLAASDGSTGARESRRLDATEAGRAALRSWINDLQDWMGGPPVDPVRTRINYLEALPLAQRVVFLEHAERNARAALAAIQAHGNAPAARHKRGLAAGLLGARLEVEARLKWLAAVRSSLSELPSGEKADSSES
jgi:DNA-binding PadR family transcriptional regulator